VTALVRLEDVSRTYRMGGSELRALDHVDLSVEEGDFVAVMGASGSGKSTLMNVIGGLDRPTGGRCLVAGEDVARLGPDEAARLRNRVVGFVFQSFQLLARTSALENVELPLVYAEVPAPERHRRARAALERVGLAGRLGHTPSQLSGGQQQRVAIARAIVTGPRLLLADEPTGNLDSRTSVEVMALFQQLAEEGLTVVLVTHEPDVARYAGRVVTMRDGRVVSDVAQPAERAVAVPAGAPAGASP
jgi:putative ABC transport system ATP-binding protein